MSAPCSVHRPVLVGQSFRLGSRAANFSQTDRLPCSHPVSRLANRYFQTYKPSSAAVEGPACRF